MLKNNYDVTLVFVAFVAALVAYLIKQDQVLESVLTALVGALVMAARTGGSK